MANGIEARLMRVIDHIDANLDGDLSLDALAEVAAFSRFHWHRSYVAVTGESCADTVRRRRLARAAEWLVGSERAMGEIARRAGYSGIPAFTRAFRAAYGQPPGAFRAAGRRPEIMLAPKERRPMTHDIIIREDPARRLCAVPYQGAYPAIGSAFERLTGRLAAREQWRDVGRMVAIYYDDPTTMPEAELRAHAACEFAEEAEVGEGLEEIILPAGRVAVLTLKGPYTQLPVAYQELYGSWLPASGETPREAAPYEIYLNSPLETAPAELLTEICVPLA